MKFKNGSEISQTGRGDKISGSNLMGYCKSKCSYHQPTQIARLLANPAGCSHWQEERHACEKCIAAAREKLVGLVKSNPTANRETLIEWMRAMEVGK